VTGAIGRRRRHHFKIISEEMFRIEAGGWAKRSVLRRNNRIKCDDHRGHPKGISVNRAILRATSGISRSAASAAFFHDPGGCQRF
jgi:hypothetical protein